MERIRRFLTASLLVFVVVSLGWAFVGAVGLRTASGAPEAEVVSTTAPIVAYYFHSDTRCTTCRAIETLGQAALADAIRDGHVEWRVVNYQRPDNAHFAKRYDLAFASLVLVKAGTGTAATWKNLDKVWDLHDDPPAFTDYVRRELVAFTEEQP